MLPGSGVRKPDRAISHNARHGNAPLTTNGRAAASRPELILLVEDEQAVRLLASRLLRRNGFTVLEAVDGDDALRVAQPHLDAIDLIITDLVMPGIDGPQLARALSSSRPGIRILYMSGYPEEDLRLELQPPGRAFIGKPFLPADLLARVAALLATEPAASEPAA
jgi:two-component system cell cycle sensor histidine kinase/response regulator CckA